ncbi:hypothetical protein DMENIID0001_076950 [Sergentomyia squamirostris]
MCMLCTNWLEGTALLSLSLNTKKPPPVLFAQHFFMHITGARVADDDAHDDANSDGDGTLSSLLPIFTWKAEKRKKLYVKLKSLSFQ